jgi:arabinan endo-1,5-alpha-L-arabinosidase
MGRCIVLLLCILMVTTACKPITDTRATLPLPATASPTTAAQPPVLLEPEGFLRTIHDPVMAKEGDTYYVFSTGSRIMMVCSQEMITWEFCGRVFDALPQWILKAVPGVGDLWAPDISFWNGKWHLYYAGSTFGENGSVIALATNRTLDQTSPDYAWVDEGEVLHSGSGDNWNAIDPNLAFDEHGQPWLAFGSYWSGLKLRKIDAQTGKLDESDPNLYALAARANGGAIEAPFIIRHGNYFYLFASFDACCQGVDSTYNVRVGRAETITGPYIDRDGNAMLEGGGTLILAAYDRWRGPGHNGIYQEGDTTWMVYHAYDAKGAGISKLRIESLGWDEAGWPYLPSQQR